ncbi:MAG TPA: DUF748 domain-containing protein [Verrucomicrobiae bacterium]|nr:DUF748 domain-containing protein [Verrucomicrobiae bacterium]
MWNFSKTENHPRRAWQRTRTSAYWIAGTIVFLICLRLALPFVLKDYVNHQLDKSHDYSGKIGGVTVHLWRGAYQIHGIDIFKTDGKVPTPLFSASNMDLSLQWSELFHGALVSKISMLAPRLNFVSGPTKEQSQSGEENNWGQILESLVPFQINSLEVTNGEIHFQNPYSKPPVNIYFDGVSALATNFTNSRRVADKLPAGIIAQGKTLGGGGVDFQMHMNPTAKAPTFELTGQLTNVNLVALNDFLRAYGKFDVAHGNFALFTSFAAKDESYDGYCKVFFKDLKVFKWEKENKKDALEIFWQAIVGTLTTAFKNQPKDQLATKIPISGSFQKTDVHIWPMVATLLQNAFIHALVPKMDQPVTVEQVEKKESQK